MNRIKFSILDVRPLLAAGVEPFPEIRKRVAALNKGAGLTVIAPFLPSPLIELLKGEGFQSTVEHGADGRWTVNFWRE